jgi:hypothetical protein
VETEKRIETAKAVYEGLTGKDAKRAKEETLATIFAAISQPEPPKPEQNAELLDIYENQEKLQTRLEETDQLYATKIEIIEKRISNINATLKNIISLLNKIQKPTPKPMPQEDDEEDPHGFTLAQ